MTAAFDDVALIVDLHEAAGIDLGPMQTERDLIVAVRSARHSQCQMIEYALMKSVHDCQTVRRRKINAGLPLLFRHVEFLLSVNFLLHRILHNSALASGPSVFLLQ